MNGKKIGVVKSVIFSVLVIAIFLTGLEVTQRVRYFLRFHHTYWLFYGFTNMPKDYHQMHERGLETRRLGVDVIETSNVYYQGYRKCNPDWKSKGYNINSDGFRGEEINPAGQNDTIRIVAMGGSTTFGEGVKDGYTYPEALERILNRDLQKKYEVINAGINACTLREITNLFKNEIVSLKPSIIVINSLANNLQYSKNAYKFESTFVRRINSFLMRKSLFYLTLREKIAYMLHDTSSDLYKAPVESMLDNFMSDKSFWTESKDMYQSVISQAYEEHIEVIIIKQPVWLKSHKKDNCGILYDKSLKPIYERVYATFDELAEENNNVEVVNAVSVFNNIRNKNEYFTSDGLHLTKKGNELLAQLVADQILTR